MSTDLLLIRHAQTACSIADRVCGVCEQGITSVGRAMVASLATTLADTWADAHSSVDEIVTSPEPRTVETAAGLAATLPVNMVADARLSELGFGVWEGHSIRCIADTCAYVEWEYDPVLFSPPDGERGAHLLARALSALIDYTRSGRTVAFVSHKHFIRLVTAYAADVPLRRYREITAPVSSVTRLRLTSIGLSVVHGSDVTHLPETWRRDPDHLYAKGPDSEHQ